MDTKKLIETINSNLIEYTEAMVAVKDNLSKFTETARDILDEVTFLPSQLEFWQDETFTDLVEKLHDMELSDDAVVELVGIYYAHKADKQSAASAAVAQGLQAAMQVVFPHLNALIPNFADLVPGGQPEDSGDAPKIVELDEYLRDLQARAEAGDEVAQHMIEQMTKGQ
jgi:hypothetical protein